jgi:DNA-binding IclR family transcriptional regulator
VTRLSPTVLRTVAILNFFADHPGQAFTLTELVRALKISRATSHSILASLVEANYLYRNNEKSYVLGPGLARVGAAAHLHSNPLQVAMPEMRVLADSLDVICSAIFLEGDVAVVRERAASVSHIGWIGQLGRNFPLHPPFGTVFMAWAPTTEIDRWIGKMQPMADRVIRQRVVDSLEFARRRGFAYGLRKEHIRDEAHAQALTYRLDKTEYLATDLAPGLDYDLAFVAAPVFKSNGSVACALALMGFIAPVSATGIEMIGQRLRQVCDRISQSIGGSEPAIA